MRGRRREAGPPCAGPHRLAAQGGAWRRRRLRQVRNVDGLVNKQEILKHMTRELLWIVSDDPSEQQTLGKKEEFYKCLP